MSLPLATWPPAHLELFFYFIKILIKKNTHAIVEGWMGY